jgi:hypothetical protein
MAERLEKKELAAIHAEEAAAKPAKGKAWTKKQVQSPNDCNRLHRTGRIDETLTNYRALLRLMAGLRAPRLLPAASGEDNPMAGTRSSSAALTAAEVNSLRRVASGLANFLSSNHRLLLTAMGLIATTGSGHLVLTQEGKERLAEEAAKQPPSARLTNPFETPPST